MFADEPDRGPPTSLRGWLSDVFIPALVDDDAGSLAALAARLGARATIDDPIFGRASGMPAIDRYIDEMSRWLKAHKAGYKRLHFTTGIDRDVTEGSLSLTFEDKTIELPIAVVAERRRSREVELRTYYSTQPIKGTSLVRSPLVPRDDEVLVPDAVANHVMALADADVTKLLAGFESDGSLRDARGLEHIKGSGLEAFYDALVASKGAGGGVEILRGGAADDGRTCALEYTLVKTAGRAVPPQAGLAVYERGDSGLLRSLRVYDDLES